MIFLYMSRMTEQVVAWTAKKSGVNGYGSVSHPRSQGVYSLPDSRRQGRIPLQGYHPYSCLFGL